jgi:lipopolysaccharide/colanic/teichoic acid biosynthesis glycosyltransferase
MKIFDFLLSLCLIVVLSGPIFIIAILIRLTSKGPAALYWSDRVGEKQLGYFGPALLLTGYGMSNLKLS